MFKLKGRESLCSSWNFNNKFTIGLLDDLDIFTAELDAIDIAQQHTLQGEVLTVGSDRNSRSERKSWTNRPATDLRSECARLSCRKGGEVCGDTTDLAIHIGAIGKWDPCTRREVEDVIGRITIHADGHRPADS